MSDKTHIEWTDATWSPVTGCTRVSDGCTHCYIERTPPFRMAHRRFDGEGIGSTTGVLLHPERLHNPMHWRKPRKVFVCSMADLFHDQVPDEHIAQVFAVMAVCPQHTFQVLTKRHARMRSLLSGDFRDQVAEATTALLAAAKTPGRRWPLTFDRTVDDGWNIWGPSIWPLPNVWLGVSAENQQWANLRIPALLDTPATVRFISAEPLLGSLTLARTWLGQYEARGKAQIDWVIAGGESGPGARPMHPHWAENLHRQCKAAGVAFTFKQWGAWTPLAPLDRQGRFDFTGGIVMTSDGNTYQPGDLIWPDGSRRGEAIRADFPHHHPTSMYRLGKGRAGRELYHDGRTFDQYPEAVKA